MADSLGSHIAKFNETLNKELGSSFSLSSFNDQVSKKKITIDGMRSNSRTEDLDFPWLSELEMVTEKIMAIASKYRTHLRVEKTVMRAEKAVRVDNYDIIATLKEPKFWKKKNSSRQPSP